MIAVVSVWLCFSLWNLTGSCHCTHFLRWLVIVQPHLGLFAFVVRSLAGPGQSQPSPLSPLGHTPSISSASSWNFCWSSFSPSGVDRSLSAFLFSFPVWPFPAALWKIPRAFQALLLSLSFCFLIFNSQELFLVPSADLKKMYNLSCC